MTTPQAPLGETELDTALALLRPPTPSDRLKLRVLAMAPRWRRPAVDLSRLAVAATLAATLAVAAMLQVAMTETAATGGETTTANAEGEISPAALPLIDPPVSARSDAEPFSVAGMPLQ